MVCLTCQRRYDGIRVRTCDEDGASLWPELNVYSTDINKLAGTVLAGRYVIRELVAEGGMGIVLRATDTALDRPCAVKLVHPHVHRIDGIRERFELEVRAASQLAHPNLVSVTDYGVPDEGLAYLVMEFLEGETLLSYAQGRGPLHPRLVANLGIGICDGLEALHERGFVHRDLKPSNIWIENQQPLEGSSDAGALTAAALVPRLIDFGAIGIIDPDPESARLTPFGTIVGTPGYMAPEQLRGEPVDGRADIYSLGAVLWELAAGKEAAWMTERDPARRRRLRRVAVATTEMPSWLKTVIFRCLRTSPERRYADVWRVRRGLEAGLANSTAEIRLGPPARTPTPPLGEPIPETPVERPAEPPPSRTGWLVGTIAILLALGLLYFSQ